MWLSVIPVMMHSADSRGRKSSHNKLGGPAAWNRFFADAENAGTRVNLAHMGGNTSVQGSTENWTEVFSQTMQQPGSENLYGDLGAGQSWPRAKVLQD
ncbi:hypothetical protein EYC98_07550 [Halieaceae bacterium IMCC14734]|uniref:Uncharacterized protein n=1 Tax=Candidatus Litorirhabdus singularis TaxID=2518993 RepID=A0ABT3TH64_9GAMM|nr:hypothetical protein [Candidatus Litorirhabdus singularis]MCX2980732.1 hypothetical protein [Candidatus Litorirhabdus singularis]